MLRLKNQRITLGVSGSIAAFKAASLCHLMRKEGAEVQVVLTNSAARFVGPATFAGLSGLRVLDDMFDRSAAGELHIRLGSESDLVVIAPATADIIARLAGGRANDLLSATALCARCPILLAPAMHPAMWIHPATQRNVRTLIEDGRTTFIGPVVGEVATGEVGLGRMETPEKVLDAVVSSGSARDWVGKHIVVTAGPTVEDIDPVRFLSNRSSGKMGFAVAARAAHRGAEVTLIAGPVSLATPLGVTRIDVRSALSMKAQLDTVMQAKDGRTVDALIMCAAVGDFRAQSISATKLKRDRNVPDSSVQLVQNPDILAELGAGRRGTAPVLVGFAVETGDDEHLIHCARGKLERKRVDMVVVNRAEDGFAGDENRAILVTRAEQIPVERCSKLTLAGQILDRVNGLWTRGEA